MVKSLHWVWLFVYLPAKKDQTIRCAWICGAYRVCSTISSGESPELSPEIQQTHLKTTCSPFPLMHRCRNCCYWKYSAAPVPPHQGDHMGKSPSRHYFCSHFVMICSCFRCLFHFAHAEGLLLLQPWSDSISLGDVLIINTLMKNIKEKTYNKY